MDTFEKAVFVTSIRRSAHELGRVGVCALAPLYDLTARRLIRYALTLTRNRPDAEDALQAAMVRIVQKPQLLAQSKHPWAYFLKIIRNEALRIIQSRDRLPRATAIEEIQATEPRVIDADLRDRVKRGLASLPPAQAEVVVLKIWEEMTFIEIGKILEESPNTIASRYRYGLEKLSHHLRPFYKQVCDD